MSTTQWNSMQYKALLLIITHFFIVVQTSHAMGNEYNTLQIIKKLTTIKDPSDAKYLTEKLVVIAGQGCSIVNLLTNEEEKISNAVCSYLAVDSSKKKIAFSYDKTIAVYNTEIQKQEWARTEEYPIESFEFSSCGNTIFLCLNEDNRGSRIITKRNYLENSCGNDDVRNPYYPTIALHPKEHIMCMVETWGDVLIYQSHDLTLEPRIVSLSHHGSYCKISSDGLIAVGDPDGKVISIIDSNKKSQMYPCIRSEKDEMFIRMLFYPRGFVLAVTSLLTTNIAKHIMRYWDAKTLQLIYTTQSLNFGWDYDFSFCFDGKEVIVAFEKECLISPVPFEVQYENDTKERFPYKLFLLKKYIDQQDQYIPNDIRLLLANAFLKTFER